jgi:ferrous iron transport protein A
VLLGARATAPRSRGTARQHTRPVVLANESESQYLLAASFGAEEMPSTACAHRNDRPLGDSQALGTAPVGFKGRIQAVRAVAGDHGMSAAEIERQLIELGFVEGARVEVLHQGLFGRDPIAVRVNEATVALRRREAASILVEPERR